MPFWLLNSFARSELVVVVLLKPFDRSTARPRTRSSTAKMDVESD